MISRGLGKEGEGKGTIEVTVEYSYQLQTIMSPKRSKKLVYSVLPSGLSHDGFNIECPHVSMTNYIYISSGVSLKFSDQMPPLAAVINGRSHLNTSIFMP